ncbi:MAG: lysine--tRNA ligase [Candidatus Aenigmatarchaeota archaeon]
MSQQHWADKLAEKIIEERGDKERYVFNFGMSLSGMMHIGNMRGELLIPSRVKRILENQGKEVEFKGVFYTQDRFKGKDGQLNEFEDPEEAEKYTGWRLIDVPDPKGCHDNWPEHFNSENQPYFHRFGIEADPIDTHEFYRMEETKKLVRTFLENKEKARKIINKYRKRNPHPEGWIPFDPICDECNRIDKTEALEIDFERGKVKYRCKACGDEGWSDIEKGKLSWRLEWAALWHVLRIDFEPYGKDHATPGGSRDSCIAICKEFGLNYPAGFAYNWVYWKSDGDVKTMTSSGRRGLTPRQFLDIGDPEVLSYLYLSTKPMKEIYFDIDELSTYYRRFDTAEAIYFGEKEARTEKREKNMRRNYELAVNEVPEERPMRVSYDTCAFVAQLTDKDGKSLEMLKEMDLVPEEISKEEREKILQRLKRARNWVKNHEPKDQVIQVQEEVTSDAREKLSEDQVEMLRKLREELKTKEWNADELQNRIYQFKEETSLSAGEVFRAIYIVLLDDKSGPRAGQLIKAIGQGRVADLLDQL